MYNTVKLKNNLKINISNEYKNFLNPYEIIIEYPTNSNIYVEEKQKVYKDTIITIIDNKKVYPSISGIVKEIKDNKVIITNDYEESYEVSKRLKRKIKFTKEEIIELLSQYNFEEKYIEELSNKKHFLINGIDDLPYSKNRYFYLKEYQSSILASSEILYDAFKPSSYTLLIKNTENEIINLYNNKSGLYPFIEYRYIEDEYPLFFKKILCNKLSLNTEDTALLTVRDLIKIYEIIKKEKPFKEIFITIASIELEESFVIKTKIGTPLREILINYSLNDFEGSIVENNILTNHKININDYVIKETTKGIYLIDEDNQVEQKCIKCGKCIEICPFNLNPTSNSKNCVNCGLCTYYCPMHRKLGRKDFNA